MSLDANDDRVGVQLFGCDPVDLATAARIAEAEGAAVIDINMGCPVSKIARKGGGSSLLRDPQRAIAIVESVANAIAIPVTVKTRLGWSEDCIYIESFARELEQAGAQLLTLHGRTRSQGYGGKADWSWIARVKQAISIPVIANGDIRSIEAAIACVQQTGADGVMCARGTLGHPWLVGHIHNFFCTGTIAPPLAPVERLRVASEHVQHLWNDKGQRGVFQARKHLLWYTEDIPEAQPWRSRLCRIESVGEAKSLLETIATLC